MFLESANDGGKRGQSDGIRRASAGEVLRPRTTLEVAVPCTTGSLRYTRDDYQ